jgi:hypothetical protein
MLPSNVEPAFQVEEARPSEVLLAELIGVPNIIFSNHAPFQVPDHDGLETEKANPIHRDAARTLGPPTLEVGVQILRPRRVHGPVSQLVAVRRQRENLPHLGAMSAVSQGFSSGRLHEGAGLDALQEGFRSLYLLIGVREVDSLRSATAASSSHALEKEFFPSFVVGFVDLTSTTRIVLL